MLKVGDTVKWMSPLDHDYYYGKIISVGGRFAIIKGIGLYEHTTARVRCRYIKRIAGGRNCGGGKRDY